MLIGFGVALLIFGLVAVIFGLIIWSWTAPPPSSTLSGSGALETGLFAWTAGNGAQIFLQIPAPLWPYTRSGNNVTVTYSMKISPVTPADPSLPLVVTLPFLAASLVGEETIIDNIPPVGQTLELVLFSPGSVAFQYQPSGDYLTGADLTHGLNIVFWVRLLVA